MHFFKTITQILTMFAVGTMALPTPCNTAATQNRGGIVARSDTLHSTVGGSTGTNDKQKRDRTWYCSKCKQTFTSYDSFASHDANCKEPNDK